MNNKTLLELWENEYKPAGKTRRDLANDFGLSERQVKRKLYNARNVEVVSDQNESWGDEKISENTAEISYDGTITLEELLALYNLDLNEWAVTKVVANRWEVGRKQTSKSIVYVSGKKEGFEKDTGQIFKEPLYQIKAWLVRKEPVPIHPPISRIVFSEVKVPKYSAAKVNIGKAIILADPQIGFRRSLRSGELSPFHDRMALSAALLLAELEKVDRVIWVGDLLDFPDLSDKFVRSPEMWAITQPALFESAWWMRQFSKITTQQDLLEGNHELRLQTAISKYIPWAYDVHAVVDGGLAKFPAVSVPSLLGLDTLPVKWHSGYPNNRVWINENLAVEHGHAVSSTPGGTAQKVLNDNGNYSVIFGHIHRHEVATKTSRDRNGYRTITAACPGFLGRLDTQIPGHKETQNWNQGVFIVDYDEYDFSIRHYPIFDGEFFWGGSKYLAPDYSNNIEEHDSVGFF